MPNMVNPRPMRMNRGGIGGGGVAGNTGGGVGGRTPIPGTLVDDVASGGPTSNSAFNPGGGQVRGGLGRSIGPGGIGLGARSAINSALIRPPIANPGLVGPAPMQSQTLPAPAPMMSAPLPAPAPIPPTNPMQSINGGGLQAPGIQDFFRQMMQRNPQFLQGLFGGMGGGGRFGGGMNTMAY